jgi:hypothetical protein
MDPISTFLKMKGITKLAEMVGSAVGKLYEPTHIRKIADAKAYAKLAEGRAAAQLKVETKAIMMLDPGAPEIAEGIPLLARASERVRLQEVRRQQNLETVIEIAEKCVPEDVSAEAVDETWSTRFFSAAAEVSHAQMQEVWGKILAAEVAKPGSFSLRALETLRNLSTKEAHIFQQFCTLLIGPSIVYKTNPGGAFDSYGPTFNEILQLRAAGLVADSDMLTTMLKIPCYFAYHGETLLVQWIDASGAGNKPMETFPLTSVGLELSQLIANGPNWAYVQALASYWKQNGVYIHVAYGFVKDAGGGATWQLLEEIPPVDQQPNWQPHGYNTGSSTSTAAN